MKKFKRYLVVIAVVVLCVALCTTASAAEDGFNASLDIDDTVEGVISVTVVGSDVLADKLPKLEIPCAFTYAEVTFDGHRMDFTLADGSIEFVVAAGGTYVITELDAPLKPEAPVVTATAGTEQVSLNWTKPVGNGYVITGYAVSVNGGTPVSVGADAASYTATGLTGGTEYTFEIIAISAAGESEPGTAKATPTKRTNPGTVPGTNPGTVPGTGSGTVPGGNSADKTENGTGDGTVVVENEDGSITTTYADGMIVTTKRVMGAGGAEEIIATINSNSNEPVDVEIPISSPTSGTVAVVIGDDGSETVIMDAVAGDDNITLTVSGNVTVKIADRSVYFDDVHGVGHWAEEDVDFVTARGLFKGTDVAEFDPESGTTRGMLMTILARYAGVDTTPDEGQHWQDKGVAWAVENGISDGTDPDEFITREQIVTMLWRLAGSEMVEYDLTEFTDADDISDWALDAIKWAVKTGIMQGKPGKILDPLGMSKRCETATLLRNYIELI